MNNLRRTLLLSSLLIILAIPAFNVLLSSFRQPGKYALELDGISGYAEVKSEDLLLSTVTLTFWVYEPDHWPAGDFLVGAFSSYSAHENMLGYAIVLMQNGGVRWTVGDGASEYGYPITSGRDLIPCEEWIFIAGEYDSKTHVSLLYCNGSKLIGSRVDCYISFENSSFLIGLPSDFPNSPVQIYNIQVYNRRLSVIELDNLYEQGVDGKPLKDSLVCWWLGSDQPRADILNDLSGHEKDAKIKGEVQWIENIPNASISEASESIWQFYKTWSFVGFFFCSGLAWFFMARKSESWLFLSATFFLFSAAFSYVCFSAPLSDILALFNILLGSMVVSLGGRIKVERSGKFSFIFLVAKDAPSRFFGFAAFSLFSVSSYIILLGESPPFSLIALMYGMLIALVISTLVSTIKGPPN